MKKFLLKILILSLVPLFVFAAPDKTQERIDYEVFKAKTEANIEALKTIKSQDIESFKSQLETQKSLTDQLNHQIDWLGNLITIGSTIITGLLLLIGFFAYRNARSDAKEVAQTEAKAWLENNSIALNTEIENLREKLKTLELEARSHADATHEQLDRILSDVEDRSINDSKSTITTEQANALNQKAEELKSKPETMYKYKEWNTKGFASYHQGDFVNAAKFWGLAASSADAKENDIIKTLFNKATVESRNLNQPEAAISTYDSLIQKFGDSQHAEVQEGVARAYFNKGLTQGDKLNQPEIGIATYDSLIQKFVDSQHAEVQAQVARAYFSKGVTQGDKLNQPEIEIATYDSLIQKFGDSQHAEVQAQVAKAYVNKGLTQANKLNQIEAAIVTYDSLIQKFGDSQHAEVQALVARAYNSLGFSNLTEAKKNWKVKSKRDVLLNKAAGYFSNAIDKCNVNDKAMILGNIAYTAWLSGDRKTTEQQLKEALKIGGEELYKGTIADTEIETVSSDKVFRVLLDKVWAEINTNVE